MNTVRTKDAGEEKPPTLENGLHLMSLIATGINRLRLSRPQIMRWSNGTLLNEWLRLLATDWTPPGTILVQGDSSSHKPTCMLSPVSTTGLDYIDDQALEAALPWMKEFHNDSIPDILETQCLPEEEWDLVFKKLEKQFGSEGPGVWRCDVTGEITWGVKLLREIFAFDGQDHVLVEAFVKRQVVWSVRGVLGLIANLVHNPDHDPLGLKGVDGDAIFPVYTGSVCTDDSLDTGKILKSIKLMWIRQSNKVHLGKKAWEFRVLNTLKDLFEWRSPWPDQILRPGRNTIFFLNSPLPRPFDTETEKFGGRPDPAVHQM